MRHALLSVTRSNHLSHLGGAPPPNILEVYDLIMGGDDETGHPGTGLSGDELVTLNSATHLLVVTGGNITSTRLVILPLLAG